MEPMRPDVRRAILDANPLAQPEDIDEYERLLAQQFLTDPDLPAAAPLESSRIQNRLRELHAKLFPGARR
jgi:hypothetical protein